MIELRGERFVVRQDQRRAAGFLDQLGHGVGFAGAGDAEQHLMFFAVQQAAEELIDGGGLIAARAVIDAQMKGHASRIAVAGDWWLVAGYWLLVGGRYCFAPSFWGWNSVARRWASAIWPALSFLASRSRCVTHPALPLAAQIFIHL